MAEKFVQVNTNVTAGAKIKVFESTDGLGNIVETQGVVITDSDGNEVIAASESTLIDIAALLVSILTELGQKTEPGSQQHVLIDNATVAVTGALTDAQLRASAVPVAMSGQVETVDPYLQQRYDIQATVIYVGYAPRGTASGASAWKIKKTDLSGGNPTQVRWTNTTAVWDNRLTETYS